MKNSKQPKIPSHSKTSFTDKHSISLIENILTSHGRVMPQLYSNDKWPNIDGFLEVQDSDGILVGRLFVQAKTLPPNHKNKFRCPISFFSSCEIDPTLLFGVDDQNKKVYWCYFDSKIIKNIDFKNNKYYKTITIDSNKFLMKTQVTILVSGKRLSKIISSGSKSLMS